MHLVLHIFLLMDSSTSASRSWTRHQKYYGLPYYIGRP